MKKLIMMIVATAMMTMGMVSCSASADTDTMDEIATRAAVDADFSLINCTVTRGATVGESNTENSEEKLVCKVLPGGQMMITHKNTIFDEGTNVKFTAELDGNKLIITETGDYGKSGTYGYYTLAAKVGKLQDGKYVMVVKRNDHVREEFALTYDSSKAAN